MYRKFLICTSLFLSLSIVVWSQGLPLDPQVKKGKLANGFTYFIRHNEEPKKRVVFYLANKVGSLLENENQQGLAHFLEHMSFNGTKHFPKNELVGYLQKSGVRFGADLNAYTSFDETVYQLPLPTDDPILLANGLQIMRDWAHEATLDAGEIDKERGVILEEARLGKGASDRMNRAFWPLLFNHSRYSQRIPIGKDTVLKSFKAQTLKAYYQDWYRPDLQALIVVGDVDVNQMEKMIRAKFSDLKNPLKEKVRSKYKISLTGKNQFMVYTDKELSSISAEIIWKFPELPTHNQADYRAQIVRSLFNQLLADRLSEISRKNDPPFIQTRAGISPFLGGLDQFNLSVIAKPGLLEQGMKAVFRENERIKQFGFTQTELSRAKQKYLKRAESSLKEKDKISSDSYVKEYLAYFLNGTVAPGLDKEVELIKADLPTIGLNDLKALTKLVNGNFDRDIAISAPESEKSNLPDESSVLSWMKSVASEKLIPYYDEVSDQPLLPSQPKAGTIISSSKDEKLGITTLVLNNGVKILLKPTKFRNNEIRFTGIAPGGTSVVPDADFQSAVNASSLITSFGLGNYNPTQFNKYLSDKQVSVSPFINERTQGITGSTVNNDLETALQLVYAYYTSPRKDDTVFKNIIDRSKANILNRGNDPSSVFQDSVSAIIGNYSPRRTGPTLAKLTEIDLDKAYQFYKRSFSNASGTMFIFVGSFDSEKIQPLLARYLGALPAGQPQKARDLNIQIPAGRIEKSIFKGTEAKATVRLYWSGSLQYDLVEKINLNALKECLQIRLLERLREDESGVYTPSVQVSTEKLPQPRYAIAVNFGCAPQNVDKLIASALDEVEKLKKNGPPAVNIEKWRAESLRSWETSLQTNSFWLGYLTGALLEETDLHQYEIYTKELEKVTSATVQESAKQYLKGNNFIQLVLLPASEKGLK